MARSRTRLALRLTWWTLVVALSTTAGVVVVELALQASFARQSYREVNRRPPHPFLQVLPGGQVDGVNAQGFRGEPVAIEKPPGTLRIFTIGGSTTLGVANPYRESYPFLLQATLQERYPDLAIEVQNAGSAWYTSAHDLVAYELRVRRFQPDIVIFFEAINDLVRSFVPPWFARGDFQPDYSHYLGPHARLLGPDMGFMEPRSTWLLWNRLRRNLTQGPDPYQHRDPDNVARVASRMQAIDDPEFRSLPFFREYVDTLIRVVTADGVQFAVGSQPFLYHPDLDGDGRRQLFFAPLFGGDGRTYPSLAAMERGMRLYNAAAREVADRWGVPFLDFEALVPKTTAYFSDDVHLRQPANHILAQAAAEFIEASGLLPR